MSEVQPSHVVAAQLSKIHCELYYRHLSYVSLKLIR